MAEVEYPGAIGMWVPESDLFTTNTHQALVIHKTASGNTPQEIAQYFINSSPGPSVHYVVGLDGTIVQCAPEALGAGGNCCLETGHDPFWDQFGGVNLNTVTISVEHVDPSSDNSTPCPQAQIDASFKLVAHLAAKYHIAPDHIKPHSSLDPQSRARCPGNYPFNELIAYVKGGSSMGVPNGWKDVNGVLVAPNGVPVHDGFRAAIENDPGFDPANVPNEAEYNANPVMLHRPDLGNGDRQTFRDGAYYWTSRMGVVWEKYPGLEIDACYKQIAAQATQISQLQAEIAQLKQQQPTVNPDIAVELQTADAAIAKAETELKA